MRYTPFDKELQALSTDDLASLHDVHEGWYVEYKSAMISHRSLAKSLSSFANQYGGWLFLGVFEDSPSHTAQGFPGLPTSQVPDALESLRNASKDLLQPPVFYTTRVFHGPIASINLGADHSLVVVSIPQGPNPPYLHNDGRIYRRIADSSNPAQETDRGVLDLLVERGNRANTRLADRISRSPPVSRGEENQPYIHLSIFSDRYETMGHWYDKGLVEFTDIMGGGMLPFDNIFSTSEGYAARQAANNPQNARTLTWEFSRHCHSFVTLPIPLLSDIKDPAWNQYAIGEEFLSKLARDGMEYQTILDLSPLFQIYMSIMIRHRCLALAANVKGPFHIKAHLENVWRTVPFIDLPEYLIHTMNYGFPLVQEDPIFVPSGRLHDRFVVAPEIDTFPSESDLVGHEGALEVSMQVFQALGIPVEVITRSLDDLEAAIARAAHVLRNRRR